MRPENTPSSYALLESIMPCYKALKAYRGSHVGEEVRVRPTKSLTIVISLATDVVVA